MSGLSPILLVLLTNETASLVNDGNGSTGAVTIGTIHTEDV